MSLINLAEIPGYAEAVDKEQTERDLAFISLPLPLCRIPVRQFCLRHLILLHRSRNAFIVGGPITSEDIFLFMWYVSQGYCLDERKRDEFIARFVEVAGKLRPIKEIEAYLATAFYDAPAPSAGMRKSYTSSAALLVDIIAREYHWDDDAIMEKPIARIFQLIRCIQRRNNPNSLFFNRSERLISDWQRGIITGAGTS